MASSANDVASCFLTNGQDEISRPLADFSKCISTERFKPVVVDEQVYNMQAKEIERLKEEVGRMLIRIKEETTVEKLKLIDSLEQLGISYHFEKQIDLLLEEIFLQNENFVEEHLKDDLYATALLFRLLRQHGFNISSGKFHQFLNRTGHFKESFSNDKKGLLSLYEAAHVMTCEEIILEEALSFATTHLKYGKQAMSSSLAKQIDHALEQPLHRGIPRVEVRHFISVYEEDEGKNPLLLRFAKLDYNHLQILYIKEFEEFFRWHKHLKTASKASYARIRLVESYFWALAVLFEPQYSSCRLLCAKTLVLLTTVNDAYDNGTIDELKGFRDALERWDVKKIDELPDYMKLIYIDLVNLYEWADEELARQGMFRPYALSKFKEELNRYVRVIFPQSVWILKKEMPAFEEYEEMSVQSAGYFLIPPTILLLHDKCGTEDVFNWMAEDTKIAVAISIFARFLNDVASYEREKKMGATGLDYYMKEYKVSLDEALKKFEDIAEEAWKDINKEFLNKPSEMSREILMPFINLARISGVLYKNRQDGYTDPASNLEAPIVAVLLNLIVV